MSNVIFVIYICFVIQAKSGHHPNETSRRKAFAYGNFVSFGGGIILHHNKPMLTNTLLVIVSLSLMANASLSFPNVDDGNPLNIIGDAIRCIILWPWKLASMPTM